MRPERRRSGEEWGDGRSKEARQTPGAGAVAIWILFWERWRAVMRLRYRKDISGFCVEQRGQDALRRDRGTVRRLSSWSQPEMTLTHSRLRGGRLRNILLCGALEC